MENRRSPSHVVIAYDATKERGVHELRLTVDGLRVRGDILRAGDVLIVLGVLHRVPNPMGYQIRPCSATFLGVSPRALEEEVTWKLDTYVNMLLQSAELCEDEGVSIEVKITAGSPMKQVIVQEVVACNATWVILDRHMRKDLRFYLKQIACKIALIQDNMSVQVERPHNTNEGDAIEQKLFYSMSKPVPVGNYQGSEGQSVISCRSFSLSIGSIENSGTLKANLLPSSSSKSQDGLSLDFGTFFKKEKSENKHAGTDEIMQKNHKFSRLRFSEAPILCSACGARTEIYIKDSTRFVFSEVQLATNDFSKDNLLGEGGYGHVYKGRLKDGQLIAAKVRKEASKQGFAEFHSEIYVLSFARHMNIVMLLGYCCKENLNILVYEYICNKSLDWHLFDKAANNLEWHQRYAIAIGIAKGLRFLHEECRGGPIIHRDMRPSNILLTHDFVPMLGDFGLAKWKIGEDPVYTRVLGTLGYLAPEYAENGIVSVRTDVYAFGIVLLQLISGRKVIEEERAEGQQSLRQWAVPLIERCALHDLIDPRIGESCDMYQLYSMAKAASLCVQSSPELRPSIGEVLHLLEWGNYQVYHLRDQFASEYKRQ